MSLPDHPRCVVSLLARGRMYGYDLVKCLAEMKSLVITEGTVYPLLSRLRKAGLVRAELEESPSGPARKYYVLTEQGERVMALMNTYWAELAQGVNEIVENAR